MRSGDLERGRKGIESRALLVPSGELVGGRNGARYVRDSSFVDGAGWAKGGWVATEVSMGVFPTIENRLRECIREKKKDPLSQLKREKKIRVGLSASMRAPGLIDSFNLRETRQPWNPYADPGFLA
ncbi:uncharacterized protein N7487_010206, partial [Penicillium crustosum]|uniref:uncharacterized protein n=1 Tax=Penicillium crustosum TaxID=36656 RepID=UPI00239943F8